MSSVSKQIGMSEWDDIVYQAIQRAENPSFIRDSRDNAEDPETWEGIKYDGWKAIEYVQKHLEGVPSNHCFKRVVGIAAAAIRMAGEAALSTSSALYNRESGQLAQHIKDRHRGAIQAAIARELVRRAFDIVRSPRLAGWQKGYAAKELTSQLQMVDQVVADTCRLAEIPFSNNTETYDLWSAARACL